MRVCVCEGLCVGGERQRVVYECVFLCAYVCVSPRLILTLCVS